MRIVPVHWREDVSERGERVDRSEEEDEVEVMTEELSAYCAATSLELFNGYYYHLQITKSRACHYMAFVGFV